MLKKGCNPECPACRHRLEDTAGSLSLKWKWLESRLSPWSCLLESVQAGEEAERWGYRNKVCLNARYDSAGWQFGMIKSDQLIPLYGCPVHSSAINRNLEILAGCLPPHVSFPLAYFVQVNSLVSLIVKTVAEPDLSWINEEVTASLKENGTGALAVHLNPSAGRRLFEKTKWIQVFGEKYARDDKGLLYSRTTFQQVIPSLHHNSLDVAFDYLKPVKSDRVMDLYCGTGISLALWSRSKADVLGIESGADSTECAGINAPGAEIFRGSCRTRIPQAREWLGSSQARTLLYVNPPRTGMEAEVTAFIIREALPEKIAYLSCSAGTLKRDLEILTGNGYMVDRLVPYDFFPWTHHVECLALLRKASTT